MYTSTFTFQKKQYDAAFYALDEQIASLAKAIPGYMGEESWENADTGLISNVYYWDSLEALQALMVNPVHQQAKAAQANWLDGYQVVVAQVLRSYGDGKLAHPCTEFQPMATTTK
ncbi:antibiotic biosynthesis monooxygenase family protein [Undibacterium sp. Di26W]|uniref:antibiotic biosynthesis monooxygenase family protein n=1 Tax=Undibacterium sp. Di26W TaxID=3413035 RepID=UPI003BF3335E